jgi:hypothetical protein
MGVMFPNFIQLYIQGERKIEIKVDEERKK